MKPISFKRPRFPAAVIRHAAIYNTFDIQRHLISRPAIRRFRTSAATDRVTAVE
jgi:hypothetical protein